MIHKVIIPNSRTVNLSFTVPENYVGEEMEVIAFIKKEGLQQTELSELLSPSFQGNPLSNKEFANWIEQAEKMPAISLQEAKSKWANKCRQLQQLIK